LTHAGAGKTVIAIFDHRNSRKKHPGVACRLLFVAHREEILMQSRDTFQGVLRDLNFGELFVGNYVPEISTNRENYPSEEGMISPPIVWFFG
jgi:superfamily II DNA or RNA helicase